MGGVAENYEQEKVDQRNVLSRLEELLDSPVLDPKFQKTILAYAHAIAAGGYRIGRLEARIDYNV